VGGWVGLQIISKMREEMPPADEVVGGREGGRDWAVVVGRGSVGSLSEGMNGVGWLLLVIGHGDVWALEERDRF